MEEEESREERIADFTYQFSAKGSTYRLRLPLKLPFREDARELAVRLMRAHGVPCYLEDDLCRELGSFARSASLEMLDDLAEKNAYGGSVFEKVWRGS